MRCNNCKHIHNDGDNHQCPTPEYYKFKRELMDAALDANVSEADEDDPVLRRVMERVRRERLSDVA